LTTVVTYVVPLINSQSLIAFVSRYNYEHATSIVLAASATEVGHVTKSNGE